MLVWMDLFVIDLLSNNSGVKDSKHALEKGWNKFVRGMGLALAFNVVKKFIENEV